jgi:hypothetical protein
MTGKDGIPYIIRKQKRTCSQEWTGTTFYLT